MMKNKILAMMIFCLGATSSRADYDAFEDKLQQPTADKQDIDKMARPPEGPLQSADIKNFHDKFSAVQTQVFKDGIVPKGASLQADNKDNPSSFHVQAPFNQLSASAQTQVLAQMPDAKTAAAPLVLSVSLDKGAAHIDSVDVAAASSSPTPLSASIPKPAAPGRVIIAPNVAPSKVTLTSSFRPAAVQPISKSAPETARSFSPMALPAASRLFVGQSAATVEPLDSPVVVSRNSVTQAFLPTSGKESIVIQKVEPTSAAMGIAVTMTMPASSVPAPIVERMTEDKPEGLSIISTEKNIQVKIGLLPDASFTVLSVRPADAQAAAVPTEADAPSDVRDAVVEVNNAPSVAPKMVSVSNAEFLKGAQQLASALGISPAAVVFETPFANPAATVSGPLAVVTRPDGNAVLVQQVKLPSNAAGYVVEGRLTNFSNTLQAEIRSRLQSSGNTAFVTGSPELVVESKADAENGFDVSSIAIAPTETSKSTVVLWKAEPSRSDVAGEKSVGVVRSMPVHVIGVEPAALTLIKTVFGEQAGQMSFQNAPGPSTIRFVSPAKANLAVQWVPTERDDQHSFVFVGKLVEFTDAIRDAVKAQLSDDAAQKGSDDIEVEFLVDQSKEAPVVKVIEAGPSPREVAEKEAGAMGLSSRDYLLVDIGGRFLIVVERGESVLVPGSAANVRLKSPDGNLAIVTNPRQTKGDSSVLLIFSRLGLKTNWSNIVRLAGGNIDDVMEKALRDNPRSDQFLVRLNPNEAHSFVVRPLNPSTATLLKPGNSKP